MGVTNNSILILDEIGKQFLDKNNTRLNDLIARAAVTNPYFTEEFSRMSIESIAQNYLNKDKLSNWLNEYKLPENPLNKAIGIVAAGNIPFVSIHDFICCMVLGANIKFKLSAKDTVFMKFFIDLIFELDASYKDKIEIIERLTDFDAVIATGSDNTSRYFEYYFKNYPHIIRGNRISMGILSGNETPQELELLCKDIFSYFGLGCRNVSQILIPPDYDFRPLINLVHEQYGWLSNHHLYKNNLDYYRTIYLMNKVEIIDCDQVNMVESEAPFSPISCVHFHKYASREMIDQHLEKYQDKIQCVVAQKEMNIPHSFNFGEAQHPSLSDYADNVDSIEFLLKLQNS